MIAPGFVYDPTGSIQKNAFKNGKQVPTPSLHFIEGPGWSTFNLNVMFRALNQRLV